ncbi:MAG TPA: TolC family protein [Opitutaceae bacterium]|nr:TolC family protein [Opitutaceae bacterium]
MKVSLLLAVTCALGPALLRADAPPLPPRLTLAQAIDAVLARHPTLDAAQAAIDAARARTEQSNADRLPQVAANGGYTYMSLRPYVALPIPGAGAFYETINNSYATSVGVRQLLTDFGRTDALVALARSGEITARDALEQARHQLGYQTIQAFYGVILLRDSVAVADEEIRALEESSRVSDQKFNNGSATKFDVLTTGVRLASARNRRTDTLAALKKQETALRELLGAAPGAELSLSGDLDVAAQPAPDVPAVIAEGLQNRPEMRLAQDDAETSQRRLDAANRSTRPVLSASAAGGVEDGQLPDMYDNKGFVTANVGLSVPLFTGRRAAGQKAEARAGVRSAAARVEETRRQVAADVEDAAADLDAARGRLANADALVDQAQEALALAQTRYRNGVITNFELLDAQSSARGAELARLQARYDCLLARQALARSAGRPPAP